MNLTQMTIISTTVGRNPSEERIKESPFLPCSGLRENRFPQWGFSGLLIPLDYRDIELFALEMNRNRFVNFEIASKCCISDSFVDHDGYSISF